MVLFRQLWLLQKKVRNAFILLWKQPLLVIFTVVLMALLCNPKSLLSQGSLQTGQDMGSVVNLVSQIAGQVEYPLAEVGVSGMSGAALRPVFSKTGSTGSALLTMPWREDSALAKPSLLGTATVAPHLPNPHLKPARLVVPHYPAKPIMVVRPLLGISMGIIALVTWILSFGQKFQRGIQFEQSVQESFAVESGAPEAPIETSLEAGIGGWHFFDLSVDLCCIAGSDGYFKRLNPSWEAVLGYSREELLAQPLFSFIHPDDRSRTEAELIRLTTDTAPTFNFENRYRCKAGSYKSLAWTATPCQDGLTYAVARDVTVRKQAEEAWCKSEERLHSLIANIPGVIYRCACDADWTMAFISDAIASITGYPAADFIYNQTRSFASIIHPDDSVRVEQEVKAAIEARQPYRLEYRLVHKDGTVRWVHERGQASFGTEDEVLWLDGALFDISEQKQAEETLHEQGLVFKNLYDGVIITNLEGRIIDWNPACERIFGYPKAKVLGKTTAILHQPDDAGWLTQQILASLESKGHWSGEIQFVRQDGSEGVCETVVVPLCDRNNQPIGSIGVNRDITDRKQTETDLKESEERFSTIINTNADGLIVVDPEGIVRFVNPAAEDLFGRSAEELMDHWLGSLYVVNEMAEINILRPTGETIIAEMRVVKILWEKETAFLASLRDVTKRHQAEEESRRARSFLQTTIDHLPVAVFVKDGNEGSFGKFRLWNKASERMFGFSEAQTIDRTVYDLYPEPQANRLTQQDREIFDRKQIEDIPEEWADPCDGKPRILHTVKVPIYQTEAESQYLLCISEDITERKQAEEKLQHNAFHDDLTDLPNRALFMNRLEHALQRSKRRDDYLFAVLFLDLDRFKVVNDSLGHLAGDRLLVKIARKLQQCLRPADTVARLGGDEFAILLDDINSVKEASAIAERLQQSLKLPIELENQEVFTTVSIGIALSSVGYDRAEELLRDADIAMYRAKDAGRMGYEIFDQTMHAEAMQLLQLEMDLRRAVDRQEFKVYYQPIVALTTGHLSSFEALIRWQHPVQGLVSPAKFIPIAEETGLIIPIGQWILRQACQQLRCWQEQFRFHSCLSISVNLSVKQFAQPDLIEQIDRILMETGLDGSSLKLEITESAIMDRAETTAAIFQALKARKIRICLDDFGTGYSSLSYLHRFPVNTLKIDRAFVSQMDTSEITEAATTGTDGILADRDYEIAGAIVALAHNLGMDAIAEGIETEQQLERLKQISCEQGQGYLFSNPLSAEAATEFIQHQFDNAPYPPNRPLPKSYCVYVNPLTSSPDNLVP